MLSFIQRMPRKKTISIEPVSSASLTTRRCDFVPPTICFAMTLPSKSVYTSAERTSAIFMKRLLSTYR